MWLGRVTSAGYGYTVGRNILCAYVAADEPAHPEYAVEAMGERHPAHSPHAPARTIPTARRSSRSRCSVPSMSDSRSPLDPDLAALLGSRQDGHGMPRAFYPTEALYAAELQRVWHGGWLFAGFAFEVPNPGDFLTLSVDQAPVLVIRGDDGVVRAFHNVCRHRGTQICRTERGHVRALVCPYHSWTYSQRGELVACHGMHDGVDKSKLGLKPVRVRGRHRV